MGPSYVWGMLVQLVGTEARSRAPNTKLEDLRAGVVCLRHGGNVEEAGAIDVDKMKTFVEGLGPGKVIL